jgi:adenylyltransferase/sulfurtransferase
MNSQRYIRQTVLQDFGPLAQQKLADAKILVVGIGGLGIPVLQYLNAMGVGTLGMVEQDTVDISNLQRQVLYAEADIGESKLKVALTKLKAQNSGTRLQGHDGFLTNANALGIIGEYDLVVDASDNFGTRYLVNDACVLLKKPFVYGALHGFEGQLSVFNFMGGPTYRCLFPEMPGPDEVPNCNENGVLGVVPGIIGTLQALEAVKMITGVGEVLSGKLLLFNGLDQSYQKIQFTLQPKNLELQGLLPSYGNELCGPLLEMGADGFQKLLDLQGDIQIIDVRTTEEYNAFNLPSSKHIPLQELVQRSGEIDMQRPVHLICQTGKRSRTAVELLRQRFPETDFLSVRGGLNSYLALCS